MASGQRVGDPKASPRGTGPNQYAPICTLGSYLGSAGRRKLGSTDTHRHYTVRKRWYISAVRGTGVCSQFLIWNAIPYIISLHHNPMILCISLLMDP